MLGSLVGMLVSHSACHTVSQLVVWLVSCLVSCLVNYLVGLFVCCLFLFVCLLKIRKSWGEYLDLSGRNWQDGGENLIAFIFCLRHYYYYYYYYHHHHHQIKNDKVGGTCGMPGNITEKYKIWIGKPGRRRIATPQCGNENNIKMNFKEFVCQDVDWIDLAQNR